MTICIPCLLSPLLLLVLYLCYLMSLAILLTSLLFFLSYNIFRLPYKCKICPVVYKNCADADNQIGKSSLLLAARICALKNVAQRILHSTLSKSGYLFPIFRKTHFLIQFLFRYTIMFLKVFIKQGLQFFYEFLIPAIPQ